MVADLIQTEMVKKTRGMPLSSHCVGFHDRSTRPANSFLKPERKVVKFARKCNPLVYFVIGFSVRRDGQIVIDLLVFMEHHPLTCHFIRCTFDRNRIGDHMEGEVLDKRIVNVRRATKFSCFVPNIVEVGVALFAAKEIKQIIYNKSGAGEMFFVQASQWRVIILFCGASAIKRTKSFENFNWVC